MTVVIQYANAYFNLKNQDFWCGRLRTDQDIDTQEETSGYRLYKKAKKEFDDLNIYARQLLQG